MQPQPTHSAEPVQEADEPVRSADARLDDSVSAEHASGEELAPISGTVKWFDATRGFGFLVCDGVDGDVLLHFSVLREHGRRSLPEGAVVECVPVRLDRGLQAKRVLSIDMSSAAMPSRRAPSAAERADRRALAEAAGEYELVEVKWFNRVKGYGFLTRCGAADGGDIFVHMETVREAAIPDLQPADTLLARIAESTKGLTAIEVRLPD